ncbi:zinc-ribbon domain-containing protein [Blastopirellula sp. JC732]|uniref:Zinc-ribbon domain-containing protein n=1 Tax=Blastopirellula sediminis TaxID=2894196 RepID=A0A9X1SF37_9BACT|nr:zinc-ribbon domain-containing protein [Blastopirellula sediminis]MCC9608548.1 zinc-ribbon domain-containing protein [Blastopirellula sediminis]MCC9628675.1 zinc-ribbon domain-containing protein [Blastopirellula sediminis]
MNAFLLVCPHCQARYQLPNADANGKAVTCKKCGQKFTAKVTKPAPQAAPKPEPTVDDLFGDFGSSSAASSDSFGASSTGASPLGAMPRRKSSGKQFPWGMVAIGGGAVAMLAILVVVAISAIGALGSGNLGGVAGLSGSNASADQAYAQHTKMADEQYVVLVSFVEACEAVQNQDQVPAFLEKARSVNRQINGLADRIGKLPPLDDERTERLRQYVRQQMAPLEPRFRASAENLGRFRSPEMVQVMLDFQAAGRAIDVAVAEARQRHDRQVAASPKSDGGAKPADIASNQPSIPSPQPSSPAEPQSPPPTTSTPWRESGGAKSGGDVGSYGDIADAQYVLRTEFVSAVVDYQRGGDPAVLVAKLEGMTGRMRDLTNQLRDLPVLPYDRLLELQTLQNGKPYSRDNSHTAAYKKVLDSSENQLISAAMDFWAADLDVSFGIESTKTGAGSVTTDLAKHRLINAEYISIFETKNDIVISIITEQGDLATIIANIRNLNGRFQKLIQHLSPMYELDRNLQAGLETMQQPRFDDIKVKRAHAEQRARPGRNQVQPEELRAAWRGFDEQFDDLRAVKRGMTIRGAGDIGVDRLNREPEAEPMEAPIEARVVEESDSDRKLAQAERDRAAAMQNGGQTGASGGGQLDPAGFGPPRGGMRPGFGPPNSSSFRDQVGAENTVTLEMPSLKSEQFKEMLRRLEGKVDTKNYSSQGIGRQTITQIKYSGDIAELAKQIDFGEVSEVLVEERTIRLKSISIPE